MAQGLRAGGGQQPQGGPAGFGHGPLAAGQGKGAQAGPTLSPAGREPEQLAAPEPMAARLGRLAIAEAVAGPHQQGQRQAVLGRHRQAVGAVVLHQLQRQPQPPGRRRRQLVAGVAGMAIAGQGSEPGAGALQQLLEPLAQQLLGQGPGQITQQRRQPHPTAVRQGRRTFEIAAKGQGGARRSLQS